MTGRVLPEDGGLKNLARAWTARPSVEKDNGFLMIKEDKEAQEAAEPVETPPITELIVVDNWDEAFKRIAPVEGQ